MDGGVDELVGNATLLAKRIDFTLEWQNYTMKGTNHTPLLDPRFWTADGQKNGPFKWQILDKLAPSWALTWRYMKTHTLVGFHRGVLGALAKILVRLNGQGGTNATRDGHLHGDTKNPQFDGVLARRVAALAI